MPLLRYLSLMVAWKALYALSPVPRFMIEHIRQSVVRHSHGSVSSSESERLRFEKVFPPTETFLHSQQLHLVAAVHLHS